MDLNDYWQENKRFVMGVCGGALVFLIAYLVVNSFFASDISQRRTAISRHNRDLADPMFGSNELADARTQNEELRAALTTLVGATSFEPRPEFQLDPAAGAANAQYLRILSRVRDDLMTRANRSNLRLEAGLGMPSLSPTREIEIVRYLEALDVVESVVDLALNARARRVERISVKLDPGLNSRDGIGDVERTLVRFELVGTSLSLERILVWTQRPLGQRRVLHLEDFELRPTRSKEDEVVLDLTVVIPRIDADVLAQLGNEDEVEG